jgi:Mannosyltransferase putative
MTASELQRDGGAEAERRVATRLRELATREPPYPADRFDDQRGIVVCAGGARMFTCAWVALSVLRRTLGCRLPIEVWHLGRQELGAYEASLLAELEVDTVDALALRSRHPARVLGGWELKSYALANCRFREVLLLDADNVPVRDPSLLFEEQAYRETGALFWPDVTFLQASSDVWELCGLKPRNEPAWESGQVVVDKARCWWPLQLVRHMNDHSDLYYRYLHGDKDTFHLAWRMLARPYAMPTKRPRVLDYGLLQHDLDGEPLFQHRSQMKWILGGDNPVGPGFAHGAECLAALAELEHSWSGRIDAQPERTAAELRLEAELAATGLFLLSRERASECVLELLPGNRIGEGRTAGWLSWHVHDGALLLAGRPGETARLQPGDDGTWQGQSLERDAQRLRLAPLAVAERDPAAIVVAALVHRTQAGDVDPERAVDALVTLGAIADMPTLLARERSRWADSSVAARVLDDARWRLGRRDPSLRANDRGDGRRYAHG